MNIGDRVRLLHGTEEGIIVAIKGKQVDIEIEEGFVIPALRSEVVKIAQEEQYLKGEVTQANEQKEKKKTVETSGNFAQKGIFAAFSIINDQKLALHLINNTEYTLPFTVGKNDAEGYYGLVGNVLYPKSYLMIEEVSMTRFEEWGTYLFQFLFSKEGYGEAQAPFVKKVRFRANNFLKAKQQAPLLNKEAYTFQLDQHETTTPLKTEETPIETQKIVEQMFEATPTVHKDTQTLSSHTTTTVDLHIEALLDDHQGLSNGEILQHQLEVFEKSLDVAISQGVDEITFIHGVGNGVLRNKIHKAASQHPQVAYYKDAQKEKFGYGATLLKLK